MSQIFRGRLQPEQTFRAKLRQDPEFCALLGEGIPIAGPPGPQGPPGPPMEVQGFVATEGDLPVAGEPGDCWIVDATGHLWAWNTDTSTWVDAGSVIGPPGPAGPAGAQGPPGVGIDIQGSVPTYDDLPDGTSAQVKPGDAYVVEDTGDLWVWSSTGPNQPGEWVNAGHVVGPPGPAGEQGLPGDPGQPGPAGEQGLPGSPGPQGSTGEQGIPGEPGDPGATGPQGVQGEPGTSINLAGTVATQADLPIDGEPGDAWLVADTGELWVWSDEANGWYNAGHFPEGPPGPQGLQGVPGQPGPPGAAGIQGPQGIQGQPGPQGQTGPPGTGIVLKGTVPAPGDLPTKNLKSGDAYLVSSTGDMWVWNGSAWVNAGHVQGPVGPAGSQGPVGPQGPVGVTGQTGPAGLTGSPGLPGAPGEPGPAGPAGADSNVPGPPGPTGPAGSTGPQGPAGPTGSQGLPGSPGIPGPPGEQGLPGPAGSAGPAGPAGPAGADSTVPGPAGPAGPAGEPGPEGIPLMVNDAILGSASSGGSVASGGGAVSMTVAAFDLETANGTTNPNNRSLVFLSDGIYQCVWNGTAWEFYSRSVRMGRMPSSGWTWDTQGASTVSTAGGVTQILFARTGAIAGRVYYRTYTAPKTITVGLLPLMTQFKPLGENDDSSQIGFGITFRDNTGKLIPVYFNPSAGSVRALLVQKWNSAASYNADYLATNDSGAGCWFMDVAPFWLRLTDNGTNLTWSWSIDKMNWTDLDTRSRTDFMTTGPNAWGIWAYGNSGGVLISVLSVEET